MWVVGVVWGVVLGGDEVDYNPLPPSGGNCNGGPYNPLAPLDPPLSGG